MDAAHPDLMLAARRCWQAGEDQRRRLHPDTPHRLWGYTSFALRSALVEALRHDPKALRQFMPRGAWAHPILQARWYWLYDTHAQQGITGFAALLAELGVSGASCARIYGFWVLSMTSAIAPQTFSR